MKHFYYLAVFVFFATGAVAATEKKSCGCQASNEKEKLEAGDAAAAAQAEADQKLFSDQLDKWSKRNYYPIYPQRPNIPNPQFNRPGGPLILPIPFFVNCDKSQKEILEVVLKAKNLFFAVTKLLNVLKLQEKGVAQEQQQAAQH